MGSVAVDYGWCAVVLHDVLIVVSSKQNQRLKITPKIPQKPKTKIVQITFSSINTGELN